MQHPDFEGHKVYCNCNGSWKEDVSLQGLFHKVGFGPKICSDCRIFPWYYINGQRPSPNSLNETVEANAKSLGAKESVGATWPPAKPTDKPASPFLTSLTLAQRQQLYANLIAFKTFASKAFGGVAVRCSVVVRPKINTVGFRAYRNGVPTELPQARYDYASDWQCYPFYHKTPINVLIIW
jgi:hypothetical protein